MSHIITTKNKLKVKFKSLDLLRRACEAVQGGQIGTTMEDYRGGTLNVDFSIKTAEVSRGIGFVKDGDQYAVKCDPYGTGNRTQELIDQVSCNYQKLGELQILAKYNYIASAETDKEGILVTGRQY